MKIYNLHIKTTLNNVKINLTCSQGNSIYLISTGHLNFPKSKRVLTFATKSCIAKVINKLVTLNNVNYIQVLIKGIGRGRTVALKELIRHKLPIKSIIDLTSLPHNGCRNKKKRRL